MKTIFDLKSEAHMLIDDILSYGIKKNVIYHSLAYRLKVPLEMAHIGRMATMTQVEKAIVALTSMRNREEQNWYIKQKKLKKAESLARHLATNKKPTILPITEQKRILAEMREGRIKSEKRKPTDWNLLDAFLALFK